MACQLGRHWRADFVVGLVAATLGIAAIVADTVSAVRDAADGEPSRDELVDAIAPDPTSTCNRDEAAGLVDVVESTGLDLGGEASAATVGRAAGRMSDDEPIEHEGCFDEAIDSGLFPELLERSQSDRPVSPELDSVTLAADRSCLR